ncbi:MAG: NAD(P)/FAD-dependent oxidoreductase [Hyphomicrobium sp.]
MQDQPATPAAQGRSAPLVIPNTTGLPHIIVVGGGAGGLELVTKLGKKLGRKKKAAITLVDRSRTHIWKPLLHEIAAGSMDVDQHDIEYQAHGHWNGFRFRYGEMIGLDRANKRVHLAATHDEDGREITPDRWLQYDILVIAIGSVSNSFGTPGVAEHAIMLDTPEQAQRFNRRLINACVRANAQPGPVRPGQLHVAIIGAGATGSELSAELHRTVRGVIEFGLDKIEPDKDIRITLIEGAPRILPALPERISNATRDVLQGLGVVLRTGARVTAVSAEGVTLDNGQFIPSELAVWAAGVKGPDVLKNLDGLEATPTGQLVVEQTLQTTRDPNVFAFGDCVHLVPPGETAAIAPRAQAAHQQASHLVRQIRRKLAGQPLEPFKYRDFGSLVSLGHYSTVGSLMGFIGGRKMIIEGFIARMMYRSLYKMHETAVNGFGKTFLDTLSRLLSRRTEPHVKLH